MPRAPSRRRRAAVGRRRRRRRSFVDSPRKTQIYEPQLDALDPAFFDEVMDMKRAYHEQAGVLEKYEELLRRYAAQLGVPFTPISPGSASPEEA